MTWRLDVLSTPALAHGGRRHVLPPERRTQLLVWLALRGAWVPRAEPAALLWPGPPEAAFRNLRKTLFRLRDVPWGDAIEQQPGALRCAAQTDLHDFEQAVAAQRWSDALARSDGLLLPGYDDDACEPWTAWLGYVRERHRAAWRAAALARLGEDLEPAVGIELSARLLQHDPLDEAAIAQHLRWLAAGGQAAQARVLWQSHAQRLRDELGVEPGAVLQGLRAQLAEASALPGTPPAAPAPRAAPGDAFVGRAAELREIDELLRTRHARLLTLLGPGGTGKTRLARRAAEALAPHYADGVTWLALEEATSADEVGRLLAQRLGLRLGGGTPLLEQLAGVLRDQRRLLVFDNVEQLAPQARPLDRLIAECPHLQVIVTSRVRLGLAAEQVLPLAGLPCPEPEDAGELEQFDAARLFVQAARRVDPSYAPAREAAAIVEICRRVDGLPLALELAAAWTRVMPGTAIAAELARGVELLHSADRSRPARQASFEAVFDHSWRLLSDTERQSLARLAVFRGGCTAEAARAVTGTAWPVLGALADKSLLHREGSRLVMHPLVQQLARGRLAEADEQAVAAAHAQHHLRLLAQTPFDVQRGDRATLQQIDADWDNCRAAWPLALRTGDPDALRAALSTLRGYADHRACWGELLGLMPDPAAPGPGPAPLPPALHADMQALRAYLTYRLDRFADAIEVARHVLDGPPDRDALARRRAHALIGSCCLRLDRLDDARRHYREALVLARTSDPRMAAQMLDNIALVEKRQGRLEAALRMSTQALTRFRLLDDTASVALCLNNLGALQMDLGHTESALLSMEESLAIAERQGLAHVRLLASIGLTQAAARLGRLAEARAHGRRALQAAQAADQRSLVVTSRLVLAEVAAREGRLDDARAEMQAAARGALALDMPELSWNVVLLFAVVIRHAGAADAAARLLNALATHPELSPIGRTEARRYRIDLGLPAPAEGRWTFPPLKDLLQRIDAETPLHHAPLIAELSR